MVGSRSLPPSIQARLQVSPELVKNLVFLGKAGTLSTEGITIGFVGGVVTDDVDAVSAALKTVFVVYSRPLAVLGCSGVAERYRHHASVEYSRQILTTTRHGKHAGGHSQCKQDSFASERNRLVALGDTASGHRHILEECSCVC